MQVDVDDELYKELKDFYENIVNKVEYPNFRNLINRALKEWLNKKSKAIVKEDMSDVKEVKE